MAYIEITPLFQCCFGRLCLLWGVILACNAESWHPKTAWSDVFPVYYKGLDRESNERVFFFFLNNNEWMNWVNTFRCNLATFVSQVKKKQNKTKQKTATSRNVRGNFRKLLITIVWFSIYSVWVSPFCFVIGVEFAVIFGGGKFTIYGIKRNFHFEHIRDIPFTHPLFSFRAKNQENKVKPYRKKAVNSKF